jgi:hypothetical protein
MKIAERGAGGQHTGKQGTQPFASVGEQRSFDRHKPLKSNGAKRSSASGRLVQMAVVGIKQWFIASLL